MRIGPTLSVLGALAAGVLVAGGCGAGGGGGEGRDGVEGLTAYHAANVARDAMDDEVIDPQSPAYDRAWIIDDTKAERQPDGRWAWRVTFVDVEDPSATLCVWVQLDHRSLTQEDLTYSLDRCPETAVT